MPTEYAIKHQSLQEIVRSLDEERKLAGRFPCRIVFVSTLPQYKELVIALRAKQTEQIKLSDFRYCSGEDTVPQLSAVVDFIGSARASTYLIEGFGEYLRMAEGNTSLAQKVKSLMAVESATTKRVWIPVFCAKDSFFKAVGTLDIRYDNAFYELDPPADPVSFKMSIYPKELDIAKDKSAYRGLRAWFKCWEELTVSSGDVIYTQKTALFTQTEGLLSLRVISDAFSYIQEHVSDASSLAKTMGTKEQWGWLASKVTNATKTVEQLIKSVLNVQQFRPEDIISRWNDPGDTREYRHWLFWLWYRKGASAGGDYFAYAAAQAKTPADIPEAIETAILDDAFKNNVDAAQTQRRPVLPHFGKDKRSKAFWDAFNQVPDNYLKLRLLTDGTREERIRCIEIVGDMLVGKERLADILFVIKRTYPVLAYYLAHSEVIAESGFQRYFEEYKHQKVQNIFDSMIDATIRKADLLAVTSRNEVLKAVRQAEEFTLWVDGMGLEWVDLLMYFIKNKGAGIACSFSTAAAKLPTITSANKVWETWPKDSYRKDDHLDAKSHIKDKSDGVDPAALIEQQFRIIEKLAEDIIELVAEKGRIVVTADHGMSRLAAIHFHKCNATSIPPDGESCQSCRYCRVPSGYTYATDKFYKFGETLVMVTHDHFAVPGYIPGETHGGMTPEEYLVPVMVFSTDRTGGTGSKIAPVAYKLMDLSAQLDNAKKCTFRVMGEGLVSLKAKANNEVVAGVKIDDGIWGVTFSTLRAGQSYGLEIYPNNIADGKKHSVSISRRGLVVEDDF